MFGFLRRNKDNEEGTATRANLGEQSTMYFCPEKKRWRERGKEHLEVEEETLAPPPMATKKKEEPPEGEKKDGGPPDAAGGPPKPGSSGPPKEANALDALCAPTNPLAHRLRGAAKAPARPAVPMGAFGAFPMQAPAAAPAADAAADETKAEDAGEGEKAADGDAPPPPAVASNPFAPKPVTQSNPFAPKGFGGAASAQDNPNRPRAFGGGAAVQENPNRPRGPAARPKERGKRPERQPRPVSTGFGNMPAYTPGLAPGAFGGASADPEGAGAAEEVAADPEGTGEVPSAPVPAPAAAPAEAEAESEAAPAPPPQLRSRSSPFGPPGAGAVVAAPAAEVAEAAAEPAPEAQQAPEAEPAAPVAEIAPAASNPADAETDDLAGWGSLDLPAEAEAAPTTAPLAETAAEAVPELTPPAEVPVAEEEKTAPEPPAVADASAPAAMPASDSMDDLFAHLDAAEDEKNRLNSADDVDRDTKVVEGGAVAAEEAKEAAAEGAHEDAGAEAAASATAAAEEVAAGTEKQPEADDLSGWAGLEMPSEVQADIASPAQEEASAPAPTPAQEEEPPAAAAEAGEEVADASAPAAMLASDSMDDLFASLDAAEDEKKRVTSVDAVDTDAPAADGAVGEAAEATQEEVSAAGISAGEEPAAAVVERQPEATTPADSWGDLLEDAVPPAIEPTEAPTTEADATAEAAEEPSASAAVAEEEVAAAEPAAPPVADAWDPSVSANGESTSSWVVLTEEQRDTSGEATIISGEATSPAGPAPEQTENEPGVQEAPAVSEDPATVDAEEAEPQQQERPQSRPHSPPPSCLWDLAAAAAEAQERSSPSKRQQDEAADAERLERLERLERENAEAAELRAELERMRQASAALETKLQESEQARLQAQQAAVDAASAEAAEAAKAVEAAAREAAAKGAEEARAAAEEQVRKLLQDNCELEHHLKVAKEKEEAMKQHAAADQSAEVQYNKSADEFNMPDFVWNCGDAEVMSYVKKLVSEIGELRKEKQAVSPPRDGLPRDSIELSPNRDGARLPDTDGALDSSDAGRAAAFLNTVAEGDVHHIEKVLQLLQAHPDDAKVCAQALRAVESLTFTCTETRKNIVMLGGVEAVLRTMEALRDAGDAVLCPAMEALWNLTFEEEAADRLAVLGGVKTVAAAMRSHGDVRDLQCAGCALFLNVASKESRRNQLVEVSAPQLIVSAMQQHSDSEEVLEQGCQALYMLAYHKKYRPAVIDADGAAAAALAASFRSTSHRAQKWGNWLSEVLKF
eukprot:TRINITY_DN7790_c0_g1_i2.p1 TRINITY_DN7790_c0_g1~~TRINITY_DN7790_c0_g1_i2.p1  ORF type:complete len:1294 (+),score=409.33 TRINITY_DN7790_c0_g1_i2:92-3883(+)